MTLTMPIQTLLTLLGIGLSAGALGGIFGIGGGLIMIPGMVLLLGLDPHTAVGTSLAVMLPPNWASCRRVRSACCRSRQVRQLSLRSQDRRECVVANTTSSIDKARRIAEPN
jgi:hypothetical protein